MKRVFLLFLVLTPAFLIANQNPVDLDSEIKKVIVFKEGAQVTRFAEIEIPRGKTIYKLAGITPNLDASSIQLKGEGDFTILSVNHQLNYFESTDKSDTLVALESEVLHLQQQVEEWNIQYKVLKEEEELILNNDKKNGKEDKSLPVDELKSMAEFYRQQIAEIRLNKLNLKRQINEQLKDIRQNQQQINEIKAANQGVETSEILVTVNAEQPVKGTFELSYFVVNAGWIPTYDIRVADVESPINLVYKANVFQSTGEEWNEVKLTLSTATPRQSGTRPELYQWNLGFYNPQAARFHKQYRRSEIVQNSDGSRTVKGTILDQETGEPLIGATILIVGTTAGSISDFDGYYEVNVPPGVDELQVSYIGYDKKVLALGNSNTANIALDASTLALSEVVVTAYSSGRSNRSSFRQKKEEKKASVAVTTYEKVTSVEFEIELPYTILPNDKEYMVNIQDYDIPAYYEYYCAPKLDEDAFLTAMITNWEDYNLLTGTSNLYFEGTFIGSALIDVERIDDTLSVSLGRDKNVVVERNLLKDYSKDQFIGNKKIESRAIEIEIRNKKKQAINLVLEDQFPVSVTDDIEVKQGDYEGATVNEDNGKLTWRLSIPAQNQEKVSFNYSVKYPKKKRVVLD